MIDERLPAQPISTPRYAYILERVKIHCVLLDMNRRAHLAIMIKKENDRDGANHSTTSSRGNEENLLKSFIMIIKSFDTVAFVSNILMHHLIITLVRNSETQLACSIMRNDPGLLFFKGGIFLLRLPVLFVMLAGSWMEMSLLISWRALEANRSQDYTTVFGSER